MIEVTVSHRTWRCWQGGALALLLMVHALPAAAQTPPRAPTPRSADYIAAVVNQELVTASEVELRLASIRADAQRAGARLPPEAQLRRQVLDDLIAERVIVTYARDSGVRVDESEIDRAVASVAAQNQLTVDQLRDRLRSEGINLTRFRASLRERLLVERVREREVTSRIRISDAEIDAFLAKQRAAASAATELNIAQILVTVPEGASDAMVAERRARAEQALARVRAGEDFARVAREVSEDGNRERGGEIGPRNVDRLPDVFVNAVQPLQPGEVAPALLRTGAGFHVLKLVDRQKSAGLTVVQTRVQHILLRPSAQASEQAAAARLAAFKRQVESSANRSEAFAALAREFSEDGSAAGGGDLGWASPGAFVPEFELAMDALPIGGVSEPVLSRFGVHLIHVVDRRRTTPDLKQLREQARNALREQRFQTAYEEWVRDLRARAYIELREPPQ